MSPAAWRMLQAAGLFTFGHNCRVATTFTNRTDGSGTARHCDYGPVMPTVINTGTTTVVWRALNHGGASAEGRRWMYNAETCGEVSEGGYITRQAYRLSPGARPLGTGMNRHAGRQVTGSVAGLTACFPGSIRAPIRGPFPRPILSLVRTPYSLPRFAPLFAMPPNMSIWIVADGEKNDASTIANNHAGFAAHVRCPHPKPCLRHPLCAARSGMSVPLVQPREQPARSWQRPCERQG